MCPTRDLNQRLRLLGELRLRQRLFVQVMRGILVAARDPERRPGALVEARYQLGRTIRQRRAAIEEILRLPAGDARALALAADARAIKARMHAEHLAQLGYWPATRMEAEPEALAATFAPRIEGVIALTEAETEAAACYLAHVASPETAAAWLDGAPQRAAFPLPPRAAFG